MRPWTRPTNPGVLYSKMSTGSATWPEKIDQKDFRCGLSLQSEVNGFPKQSYSGSWSYTGIWVAYRTLPQGLLLARPWPVCRCMVAADHRCQRPIGMYVLRRKGALRP